MLKTAQKQNYKDISLDRRLTTEIRMVQTMAKYIDWEAFWHDAWFNRCRNCIARMDGDGE